MSDDRKQKIEVGKSGRQMTGYIFTQST